MTIRAGQLNRQVSIQSPSTWTRSTDGQPVPTWTTVLDTVWASKQPISAREMFQTDVRWSELTTKWVLRYSTAVNSECRLIDIADSSAVYEIEAVIDIGDQQVALELLTKKTS